jgi:plastocyanin
MKRLTLTLGLLALAAVLAACSGASAAPGTQDPSPAGSPSGDAVAITARDMKFVPSSVSVKAGSPFAVAFDNQDGAPHNIRISDASGAKVFAGEIVSSQKVTYQVPALAAGMYSFICEVHPDMKGTITAQ